MYLLANVEYDERDEPEIGSLIGGFMKKVKGFTLVELIIVLVILGILAGFAYTRYADLMTRARYNTMKGVESAVSSAAVLGHAVWLVSQASPSTIVVEGKTVEMVNAYPSRVGMQNMMDLRGGIVYDPLTGQYDFKMPIADCNVIYNEALAGGAPIITVQTTGCLSD